MTTHTPRVTIGLPVYNGEAFVASAIESILVQTYADFRLVISDNASTDATEGICRELAERDHRITYVRQASNIGADANFGFLLDQAQGEYFMWAAADDTRSADFLQENLDFLDAHLDFVGSTCPVRFEGGDYDPVRMGDETRDETAAGRRVLRFYDCWHANGRFYSLFRRQDLIEAWRNLHPFLGKDWIVIVRLLAKGKMNRTDHGSVDLGRRGISNSTNIFPAHRSSRSRWLLPLLDLQKATWSIVRREPLLVRARIELRLIKLSLLATVTQVIHAIKRAR